MNRYQFTAVLTHEDPYYVALCVELGVVSQGETVESALANLREAVELYTEDMPRDELAQYSHRKSLIAPLELEYA